MFTQTQRDTGWDLAVYDRYGQPILAVQIKNKLHTSAEWAAKFRRNILAHRIFPKIPYFLMVFLDKFYLWAGKEASLDESEPTYIIDARPIVQPYFEKAGIESDRQISAESLELIFSTWLTNIIYSKELPDGADESQRWLIDSGLYPAIAGGSFVMKDVITLSQESIHRRKKLSRFLILVNRSGRNILSGQIMEL